MLWELVVLTLCSLGGAGFAVAVVDWRLLKWIGKGLGGEVSVLFGVIAALMMYVGLVDRLGEWRVWHLVMIVLGTFWAVGESRRLRGLGMFDFGEFGEEKKE